MNMETVRAWPKKSRDSTVWDTFKFRDDDIVIATYAKSGTTWMQQIVRQLVFNGAEGVDTSHISPWIDLRIVPPEAHAALEAQTHRRFVKTHLPVDALVFSPRAKYLYLGRDGRDMVWSLYNHHAMANDHWYGALNNTPGRVGPPIERPPTSVHDYYRQWFDGDGAPFWSYWENVRSWWVVRDLPNVKLIHFNDLKRDLPGSIRAIAKFLEIPIDGKTFLAIAEHCSFDYMKAHAEEVAPLGGALWEGGGSPSSTRARMGAGRIL
jgi:aryl sulfotransferase